MFTWTSRTSTNRQHILKSKYVLVAAKSLWTPHFCSKLNQITLGKLWTQTRCIPDLNPSCGKLPYLVIVKIHGLLCHFLRSGVLKLFFLIQNHIHSWKVLAKLCRIAFWMKWFGTCIVEKRTQQIHNFQCFWLVFGQNWPKSGIHH